MLRRQIQVLTAEGRLSAWVLALLPIGIALYMSVVNPDYIGLLVTTTMGWVMVDRLARSCWCWGSSGCGRS